MAKKKKAKNKKGLIAVGVVVVALALIYYSQGLGDDLQGRFSRFSNYSRLAKKTNVQKLAPNYQKGAAASKSAVKSSGVSITFGQSANMTATVKGNVIYVKKPNYKSAGWVYINGPSLMRMDNVSAGQNSNTQFYFRGGNQPWIQLAAGAAPGRVQDGILRARNTAGDPWTDFTVRYIK